jgi:hypothetical protein
MKRCSASLIIKEIEIKTMMRYHFILIRMATIKLKNNNITNFGEDVEKFKQLYSLWDCEMVQLLWEIVFQVLKN